MNTSIRWEGNNNKWWFVAYITDHSAGGEERIAAFFSNHYYLVETKENVRSFIKRICNTVVPSDDSHDLFISSISQLRVLGVDLTISEEEEDSLGLEPGTWNRIGEAYAKGASNPLKIDLSPGAIHINPHMTSQNSPLVDEEEAETWVVGDSHEIEWFDDETLEKEYNEMLEEGKEDFGINTAEKVDGAKAMDILKGMI